MKKNFFKKLALVMALAVTVTSIPANSASAAAAPGFKSKAVKVNVGQTKKYNTANSTKYSVNFKIGNKSVATIAKSGKAVKVTGVAAGKTTLRADFKSYKTKKVTTARIPVTVIEEATTLKSVEAKGVKTLVATFNKAVDTTKAVVAVTKGSAKPSISATTWADDKKSVTLTMGSKLTEGTYTASVTGLTEAALTASVTVKDETLTSIEILGTNLVADVDNVSGSNFASIGFKTLNQYGERMAVSATNATSSFGSTTGGITDCSASRNGEVKVHVVDSLAVLGTTGTITIIDTTKGVTATATVTYSAASTAKTMTVAGIYDTYKTKVADISKGDTISNYAILATIQDQYGNALNASKLNTGAKSGAGMVNATLAAGLTGVTGPNGSPVTGWFDVTVDGKDYVAHQLAGGVAAVGTAYITFVNPSQGLLAQTSFTVSAGTVVKTLNISANDTIYQGSNNTLAFEAIDSEGNAITKYDTLVKTITFSPQSGDTVKFVKQADGTAKLVYNPDTSSGVNGTKKFDIRSFTAAVNDSTSANYQVKSLTFTTYEKKVAVEVTGLKAGTTTAVAFGGNFRLNATSLVIEDQYGNVMSDSDVKALNNINLSIAAPTGASGNDAIGFDAAGTTKSATMPTTAGNHFVTLYSAAGTTTKQTVVLSISVATSSVVPGYTDKAAKEITIIAVDPMKAANITIKSVNGGDVVMADASAAAIAVKPVSGSLTKNNVKVTGTVEGKIIEIPTAQYDITGDTGSALVPASSTNPAQTLTGKVTVTVDTNDGSQVASKDYTYSNAASTLTTIEAVEGGSASGTNVSNSDIKGLFTFTDQYGNTYNGNAAVFNVVDITSVTSSYTKANISLNNTNSVSVSGATAGTTELSITASYGSQSVTVNITL